MKNKLLILITIITFSLGLMAFTPNVYASQSNLSREDILINNGFTKEQVDNFSEYNKNLLLEQIADGGFEFRVVNLMENIPEEEFITYGQIPEGKLDIIIATSNHTIEYNYVKEVKVRVYYDWLELPVWRLEDPIIVSWDSDKFEYIPGSFYSEDRYQRDGDFLHVSRKTFYEKNQDTFCWYTDLKVGNFIGIGGKITKLYGFGELILKSKVQSKHIESYFGVTYVHSKVTVEGGISIFAEVGFSVPGTGNDQISTEVGYLYEHYYDLNPQDYKYEAQYFFYNKDKEILIDDLTINTNRLRTGYIEEEYIVLSPKRANAGEAYLSMSFNSDIRKINLDLTLWSRLEGINSLNSDAKIQFKAKNGNWITALDLFRDINLPTNRNNPQNVTINFPEGVNEIRFIVETEGTGNKNKGRICIGNLKIYTFE